MCGAYALTYSRAKQLKSILPVQLRSNAFARRRCRRLCVGVFAVVATLIHRVALSSKTMEFSCVDFSSDMYTYALLLYRV